MFPDVANFLSFQIRRSTENGDTEEAMAQLRRYLELERESKLGTQEESSNVRKLPIVRQMH